MVISMIIHRCSRRLKMYTACSRSRLPTEALVEAEVRQSIAMIDAAHSSEVAHFIYSSPLCFDRRRSARSNLGRDELQERPACRGQRARRYKDRQDHGSEVQR